MLIGFHMRMLKNQHTEIEFADVLTALDDERERRPNSPFAQECRAIAELRLRDVLGVRRLDA